MGTPTCRPERAPAVRPDARRSRTIRRCTCRGIKRSPSASGSAASLGYAFRLPTEWEWVQAAIAGHADYNYPWGWDWNPDFRCHREGLNRPISVGMYPRGASPTGVLDLAGNVYEWCLNEFDNLTNVDLSSTKPHTTRGGAYFTMPPGIDVPRNSASITVCAITRTGTRERGQRLAVCIRLACDDPPPERLTI